MKEVCGYQLHDTDKGLAVRDLWVEGRGRSWQAVGDKLSHSSLIKLASVTLSPIDSGSDKTDWLTTNGHFSVRAAYDLYTGAHGNKEP